MKRLKRNAGSKIFVQITNIQIYKEICEFKANNEIKHNQIMKDMDTKHNEVMLLINSYNSKISNLKYAIGGIGILTLTTLGFLVNSLLK